MQTGTRRLSYTLVNPPKVVIQTDWDALFHAWAQQVPDLRGTVVVGFINADDMAVLYEKSFGRSEPTDVLSFKYDLSPLGHELSETGLEAHDRAAGEIVICTEVAAANAKKFGVTLANELATLFVHGLLHLLDLDHASTQDRVIFEDKTHAIMSVINEEPAPLWSRL